MASDDNQQESTTDYALTVEDEVTKNEEGNSSQPSPQLKDDSKMKKARNASSNKEVDHIATDIESRSSWTPSSTIFWSLVLAIFVVIFPFGVAGLCHVLSEVAIWKEEGIGTCGTYAWLIFITIPLAVVIVVFGLALSYVSATRKTYSVKIDEKQENLISKYDNSLSREHV